jgi:hypothetical protein
MKEDPEARELVERHEKLRDDMFRPADAYQMSGRRDQIIDEIERWVDDIRKLPKYGSFLSEPAVEDILGGAEHGAVIIVNCTDFASHANHRLARQDHEHSCRPALNRFGPCSYPRKFEALWTLHPRAARQDHWQRHGDSAGKRVPIMALEQLREDCPRRTKIAWSFARWTTTRLVDWNGSRQLVPLSCCRHARKSSRRLYLGSGHLLLRTDYQDTPILTQSEFEGKSSRGARQRSGCRHADDAG